MTKEGYQQEGEAVAKWNAPGLLPLNSPPISSGATEHLDLRAARTEKTRRPVQSQKIQRPGISYGSPREIRSGIDGLVGGNALSSTRLAK